MNQNQTLWTESTKKIFTGVLVYSVAGVIHSVVEPINSLMSGLSSVASFASGGQESFGGGLQIFMYLLLAAIVGGYFLYFTGLTSFAKILEEEDANAVIRIRLGALLMMIAALVSAFLWGLLGGIVYLIGFVLMMLGFSHLKKSTSFPEKARVGASRLFLAMVLAIVGAVIGLIPFVGAIIEALLSIVSFIFVLMGWVAIKNADQSVNV